MRSVGVSRIVGLQKWFTSEKIGKFPKAEVAWEEGLWLGRDAESQHFVGAAYGVIQVR